MEPLRPRSGACSVAAVRVLNRGYAGAVISDQELCAETIRQRLQDKDMKLPVDLQEIRRRGRGPVIIRQSDLVSLLVHCSSLDRAYGRECVSQILISTRKETLMGSIDLLLKQVSGSSYSQDVICHILVSLVEKGDLPMQMDSIPILKKILCPHLNRTIGPQAVKNNQLFSTAIKSAIRGSNVTVSGNSVMLNFIVEWTAVLPAPMRRFEIFKQLVLELYKEIQREGSSNHSILIEPTFWARVLQTHKAVRIKEILDLMSIIGVSSNEPVIEQSKILRNHNVSKCEKAIRDFNTRWPELENSELFISLLQHYVRLAVLEGDYFSVNNVQKQYSVSPDNYGSILCGSLRGSFGAGDYNRTITISRDILNLETDRVAHELALNFKISALACLGQVDPALTEFQELVRKYDRASEDTLFYLLRAIIAVGRISLSGEKKPSRPKYSVESGMKIIRSLFEQSSNLYLPPSPYIGHLFVALNHMDMSYDQMQSWCIQICNLLKDIRQVSPDSRSQLLDSAAINQIVFWGFFKSPKKPWSTMALFSKLKEYGIDVPLQTVVTAYSHEIASIFTENPKGPYCRIKQQMDRDMTLRKLLEQLAEEWRKVIT